LPLDPDPDSQYGSVSTKSLNPDPIRIRIHNPELNTGIRWYWEILENWTNIQTVLDCEKE
jgi:hypothetical protein